MWKKERDALYYSSKNSGVKGRGVKSRTPVKMHQFTFSVKAVALSSLIRKSNF